MLQGTPRYSKVLQGAPRSSKVLLQGPPRSSKVPRFQGTPRCSEVLQGLGDYLQYIRYLACCYLSSVSSLAKGTSGPWRHKWSLETEGPQISTVVSRSSKVLQGSPRLSEVVYSLYCSKVLGAVHISPRSWSIGEFLMLSRILRRHLFLNFVLECVAIP